MIRRLPRSITLGFAWVMLLGTVQSVVPAGDCAAIPPIDPEIKHTRLPNLPQLKELDYVPTFAPGVTLIQKWKVRFQVAEDQWVDSLVFVTKFDPTGITLGDCARLLIDPNLIVQEPNRIVCLGYEVRTNGDFRPDFVVPMDKVEQNDCNYNVTVESVEAYVLTNSTPSTGGEPATKPADVELPAPCDCARFVWSENEWGIGVHVYYGLAFTNVGDCSTSQVLWMRGQLLNVPQSCNSLESPCLPPAHLIFQMAPDP